MAMSARDRRAVILGGAALVAVFGYLYAVRPFLASWVEARERIAFAEVQEAGLAAQVTQLAAQKRMLEPMFGKGVSAALKPIEQTRIEFVRVVEELLKANGLKSEGVRSQPAATLRELPGVAVVSLQVQAMGQAMGVTNCLAKMGEAEGMIVVQQLDLTPDAQRPDQMRVSMVVSTLAQAGATK